jgi:hypothetical protein
MSQLTRKLAKTGPVANFSLGTWKAACFRTAAVPIIGQEVHALAIALGKLLLAGKFT